MPVTLFADVNNIGLDLLLSALAGFAVLQGAANYHTGPRSTKHELLSVRNKCAPIYAGRRVLLFLRCAVTTPKSRRTPGPGSAQRPSPQARSSAHNSNRLSGVHAAVHAETTPAPRKGDLPARACSPLRLAVISLPNSMVARTLFIK